MPQASSGGSITTSATIVDNEIVNADINSAAGIVLSKLNGVTASDANSNEIQLGYIRFVSITLSAADILALHTTAKVVLAAPGAGKIIVPLDWEFYLDYNSVPFINGDDVCLSYNGSTSVEPLRKISNNAFIVTADNVSRSVYSATDPRDISTGINQPLTLKTTVAYLTGNSTARLWVTYKVLTLA